MTKMMNTQNGKATTVKNKVKTKNEISTPTTTKKNTKTSKNNSNNKNKTKISKTSLTKSKNTQKKSISQKKLTNSDTSNKSNQKQSKKETEKWNSKKMIILREILGDSKVMELKNQLKGITISLSKLKEDEKISISENALLPHINYDSSILMKFIGAKKLFEVLTKLGGKKITF